MDEIGSINVGVPEYDGPGSEIQPYGVLVIPVAIYAGLVWSAAVAINYVLAVNVGVGAFGVAAVYAAVDIY